jgi:hypothetical protein
VRRLYHQVNPKSTLSADIILKPARGRWGGVMESGSYGDEGGGGGARGEEVVKKGGRQWNGATNGRSSGVGWGERPQPPGAEVVVGGWVGGGGKGVSGAPMSLRSSASGSAAHVRKTHTSLAI